MSKPEKFVDVDIVKLILKIATKLNHLNKTVQNIEYHVVTMFEELLKEKKKEVS